MLSGYRQLMTMSNTDPILTSPERLAEHLADPAWRVVDCRFDLLQPEAGHAAWRRGHIPGACHADLDRDLASPPRAGSGRHPLPDPDALNALFGKWALTPEVQLVAYNDVGGAIAARLWWLARWMGHTRVSLLDGGLAAWQAAGQPLNVPDQDPPPPEAGCFEGRPGGMPVATTAEIERGIDGRTGGQDLLLLDARSEDRFLGRAEPIDRIAGHVPGAINTPVQMNLNAAGRFRSAEELRSRYRAILGEHSAVQAVCMCGSGVTACHTLFALELAGLAGARLYVGSWSEWINRESPAIAVGESGSGQADSE